MCVNTGKVRLLLVDDDLISRIGVRAILESAGYVVDDAENGKVAINKFMQYNYTVILMDYNMPYMDGATVTKELRSIEENRNLIIVGVTANIDPKVKAICLKSGMNTVISKPVDINKLNKLIHHFINKN